MMSKVKEWFNNLFKKTSTSLAGKGCEHAFATRQIWTRVATKQFELQNKIVCTSCSYSFTAAIK